MKQILFSGLLCGFLALTLLVFSAESARADCAASGALPTGPQGALEYDSTAGQHFTCDNTDTWTATGGSGSGSGSGSGANCATMPTSWSSCSGTVPNTPDGLIGTAVDNNTGGNNCSGGNDDWSGSKDFTCNNGTFTAGGDTCTFNNYGCSGGCTCGTSPCGGSCPDDDDDMDESREDLPWERWSREKFMGTINDMKAKGMLH